MIAREKKVGKEDVKCEDEAMPRGKAKAQKRPAWTIGIRHSKEGERGFLGLKSLLFGKHL